MNPDRRHLFRAAGGALLNAAWTSALLARDPPGPQTTRTILNPPIQPGVTLASAPIELAGDWGKMLPHAADQVIETMRGACLDGLRLVSDRQPTRIRVDEHTSGPPAIWLHDDGSTTAWIIVDVGERAWSQLAYQFGHELGHVAANSWLSHAKPKGPCQWLEEAMVEAFSLRGLGRLGARWKQAPPFAGDNAYGDAILHYRQDIVAQYQAFAAAQGGLKDMPGWFKRHRRQIEGGGGLNAFARAASIQILEAYEGTPACVEALGALNRWPGRTGLPLGDYLRQWEVSCDELGAARTLPAFIRSRLGVA